MNRREFGLAASATALSLSVVNQALAQTPPTLLPLSAWGALPAIELVALSADASRLAFVGVAGEQRRLILQTIDGQVLGAIGLGDTKVVDIAWAGNDDIVITTSKTTSLPEVGMSKREFYPGPELQPDQEAVPQPAGQRSAAPSASCGRCRRRGS
jgi:hypothetical protein